MAGCDVSALGPGRAASRGVEELALAGLCCAAPTNQRVWANQASGLEGYAGRFIAGWSGPRCLAEVLQKHTVCFSTT